MATEVLLSFSNAGLGSIFATWLRRRIMRAKSLFDTRSVYMDNIAMREQEGTELTQDRRFQAESSGITLIGARNASWNAGYLQAMSECSAMIIVATPEWAQSQWTWQEFAQASLEAQRRGGSGGFRRVALAFDETDTDTRAKLTSDGWSLIPCRRIVVGGGQSHAGMDCPEASAHQGGWVIGEANLQQVLAAI
ncbi:hypothetical protein [Thiohalocapsa sp. ML1]|jgi:hypothetical protein|uniref:hypothetical protein n=1 Tax=Thiohalocapsa sp. ML1 TaxID=1431688 RepID=UPI0007322D8A|nr:hypothetical protein [Thiohalocapsa sp. ML1]